MASIPEMIARLDALPRPPSIGGRRGGASW